MTKAVVLREKTANGTETVLPRTSADLVGYSTANSTANSTAANVQEALDEMNDNFQGEAPGVVARVTAVEGKIWGLQTGQTGTEDRLDVLETKPDPTPAGIGAVPATRVITAGAGLTGGGNLTADRTLTVKYGTAAGTAAQGNDIRLSGGADWTASKPGVVKRVEALEARPDPTPAGIGALAVDGTAVNAARWNGAAKTVSSAGPSGGADNDVWFQYI